MSQSDTKSCVLNSMKARFVPVVFKRRKVDNQTFGRWVTSMVRILVTACLLMSALVNAQSHQQVKFNYYNLDTPKLRSFHRDIAQDDKGNYWFSTQSGVMRFDGVRLERPQGSMGQPLFGVLPKRITHNNRHLFIGSSIGLYRLNTDSFEMDVFQHIEGDEQSLPDNQVKNIVVDHLGRSWILNYKGASLFSPENKNFKNYLTVASGDGEPVYNMALDLVVDDRNVVWALTRGRGLMLWDQESKESLVLENVLGGELLESDFEAFRSKNISTIERLRDGRIVMVVGTILYSFTRKGTLLGRLALTVPAMDAPPLRIEGLLEAEDNELWINTSQGYVLKLDLNKKAVEYDPFVEFKNEMRGVNRILLNKEGEIVLNRWTKSPLLIRRNTLAARPAVWTQPLAGSTIFWSSDLDEEYLLAISNDSRILLMDKKTKAFEEVKLPQRARSVVHNLEYRKIVFTDFSGVPYVFDIGQQKLDKIEGHRAITVNQVLGKYVYLYKRENGTGIYTLDLENHEIKLLSNLDERVVNEDSFFQKEYWAATYNKLYWSDGRSIQNLPFDKANYKKARIFKWRDKLYLWGEGMGMAVLTLEKTDGHYQVKERITTNALSNSDHYFIGVIDELMIFLSFGGDKQAAVAVDSDGQVKLRTVFDDHLSFGESFSLAPYGHWSNLLYEADGQYFEIDRNELLKTFKPEEISISSLFLTSYEGQVSSLFNLQSTLKVSDDKNAFTVRVSSNQKKSGLVFYYRLKGYNENWMPSYTYDVGFTGVPAGRYVFELKPALQSEVSDSIGVEVEPKWWLSTLAYSAYALIFLLIVGFYIYIFWDKRRFRLKTQDRMDTYAKSFESISEAYCVVDNNGCLIESNYLFSAMLGGDPSDFNFKGFVLDKDGNSLSEQAGGSISKEGGWTSEVWIESQQEGDAKLLPFTCQAASVYQQYSGDTVSVFVFSDISERVEQKKHLTRMANYDHLTGLPNRRLFTERLQQQLEASQDGSQWALIYLDLDRFKGINDSLGHHCGDILLKEVASRFTSCLRPQDFIARIGGDEFVVIVSNFDSNSVITEACKSLIVEVEKPLTLNEREFFVSLSAGISRYPEDGVDENLLLQKADAAMYSCKGKGGSSFAFYTDDMDKKSATNLRLESDMRRAVNSNEFTTFYQPKVELSSGSLLGFEALVRWHNPVKGLILPGVFIDAAERTGVINKIGLMVLHNACQQLQRWQEKGVSNLTIAINVSPQQLAQGDFITQVKSVINFYSFRPSLLEFEVTEGMLMQDMADSITKLEMLKQMGHSISVDDFGTGYSSLSYLKKLPIDTLKIDQSFITDVLSNTEQRNIVRTIVELAKILDLKLIAEGVETRDVHDYLLSIGCNIGQGFWYGRPMTPKDLDELAIADEIKELIYNNN